ncbi:MAG: N-acetyltransferase [Candidatus Competibacteraceae bacterium]|jgi:predicted N-acetyltransferase YhbS|nr:N-acetyltransferase [Candidatus Competibacteraceae bacterium]
MRIVPFDSRRHDRSRFASGDAGLDEYLRRYAGQAQRNGLAQVYVAVEEAGNKVLGYYSLSAASVRHEDLPADLACKVPKHPLPAVLIGRMASDSTARQFGLRVGSRLLIDALKQTLHAAETIGVRCVVVDSKPVALGFYNRFGFIPLKQDGLQLYLPVGTIRKMQATSK